MRVACAVAVAILAVAFSARADVYQGSYTAVDTSSGPYSPTINDNGGAYLPGSFSGALTVGQSTGPISFLQVAPVSGGSSVGTITGSIAIAMTLAAPDGSAITSVTSSAGGNGATLSNGTIDFLANYELFYANQTDCLSWNSTTCTPTNSSTTPSETLTVTFADDAILDITLYDWSDWNMAPDISFELMSGPVTTVAEPASLALFTVGLAALWMLRRRFAIKMPLMP